MLRCENCGISIRGQREQCPLCQSVLTGSGQESEEVFPVPRRSRNKLLLRLLFFLGIAAAVICVAVDIMLATPEHWSAFVVLSLLCVWLSVAVVLRKRRNIPKAIVWEVVVLSGMAVVWDAFTSWRGWSVDFAIPCLCIAAMIVLAILTRTLKLEIDDYMIYLLIDALFGVAPLVLLLTGSVTIIYPSVICVTASVISLIAVLMFQGHDLSEEIKRRLHL